MRLNLAKSGLLLPLALATLLSFSSQVRADNGLPLPAETVALTQPVGQYRLFESNYKEPYWRLMNYFETQMNQAYCSVASSVIALNALGVTRPKTSQYPDFPFFTQAGFFDKVDPKTLNIPEVARTGLTLEQLADVLVTHPVTVERKFAAEVSLEQFRDSLKEALRSGDRMVLLNFDRKEVKELGGGHWSPIAAYHASSDSILVLDVARYKYPPLWLPLNEVYAAARSVDADSELSRGLLLIGKK
ncbi:phytochelatin synthase family protein [soil metagenome]